MYHEIYENLQVETQDWNKRARNIKAKSRGKMMENERLKYGEQVKTIRPDRGGYNEADEQKKTHKKYSSRRGTWRQYEHEKLEVRHKKTKGKKETKTNLGNINTQKNPTKKQNHKEWT